MLFGLFCVNALTSGLKLSRCVCLKIKLFEAIMLLLFSSVVGFSLRECSPSSYVCSCSENSWPFGESAVVDETLSCLFSGSLKS